MAKFTDFEVNHDVEDIMEKILDAYPNVFEGFDVNLIQSVMTQGKKSRKPITLRPVRYPYNIFIDKAYVVEVFKDQWDEMSDKQRGLAVFHVMCAIPENAFDVESNNWAKKKRYDYEMYAEEFAVTGGIPNWMENTEARDVFDAASDSGDVPRNAITADKIAQTVSSDEDDNYEEDIDGDSDEE